MELTEREPAELEPADLLRASQVRPHVPPSPRWSRPMYPGQG